MIGKIALVASVLIIVFLNLNLLWVMACVSFGAGVNFFLTFYYSQRYTTIKLTYDKQVWKKNPQSFLANCHLDFFKSYIF